MDKTNNRTFPTIADKKITEALNKQEAYQVRERILSENIQGSMVSRRLLWLLGKTELGNIRQILDIGSWHLNQSYEFSIIFENARIDAFEPVPDSYQFCLSEREQKIDEQKKNRISVHNLALSNAAGEIPFYP